MHLISYCIFVILMQKTKAAVSKSSVQVWSWETLGIKYPLSGHSEEEEVVWSPDAGMGLWGMDAGSQEQGIEDQEGSAPSCRIPGASTCPRDTPGAVGWEPGLSISQHHLQTQGSLCLQSRTKTRQIPIKEGQSLIKQL